VHSRIDAANNIFEAEGEWVNSYEAQQHRQHIEPISDFPVCWTLTGYASGHSSAIFGGEVFYLPSTGDAERLAREANLTLSPALCAGRVITIIGWLSVISQKWRRSFFAGDGQS
jgi:hypothetical protein